MLTYYIVRHGLKNEVPFDPALTEIGINQAKMTSEFLKYVPFDEVVASTKLRTQQTARLIAEPKGTRVLYDERLIERLEWESSQTFQEFLDEWIKTDFDRFYEPKIGYSSVYKGMVMREVLDNLYEKNSKGNVLVVSHGGSIGDLLRNIFGEENLPHAIDPNSGAKYIKIKECSITKIERSEDKFNLLSLNDYSHLGL